MCYSSVIVSINHHPLQFLMYEKCMFVLNERIKKIFGIVRRDARTLDKWRDLNLLCKLCEYTVGSLIIIYQEPDCKVT